MTPSAPSAPSRRVVMMLCTSFDLVTRLRRELGDGVELVRHSRVTDALESLTTCLPLALLLEPTDARGTGALPLMAAARRRDPEMPVIAIVRRATGWSAATVALLEAQPTAVSVEEDHDLTSVVRALAARLTQAALVARIWPQVEDDVPEALRPLVRVALARATGPLSVEAVADALGLHRKTLWSQCRRHGVGSVQAMMTWCRLLAASHALQTSSRPIDVIAEDLAFASPTAMRNSIRRHLGTTASALRGQKGERLACNGFRRWLRGAPPPHVTMSDVA